MRRVSFGSMNIIRSSFGNGARRLKDRPNMMGLVGRSYHINPIMMNKSSSDQNYDDQDPWNR